MCNILGILINHSEKLFNTVKISINILNTIFKQWINQEKLLLLANYLLMSWKAYAINNLQKFHVLQNYDWLLAKLNFACEKLLNNVDSLNWIINCYTLKG